MAADSALPGIPGYDPDNLQPWTVAVVASVTVLAVVAVALRLLSRYIKAQKLWWDDYMIMFSMSWNFVVVGFIFAMYSAGMGIHADKVSLDKIVLMAKFLVVAEILYIYNLVWTKLAILLMYYRIFHFPYFKKMAYIVGGFVVAWCICCMFLFIFICVPVEKLWYPELPGHCINQVGTWIANAASTILTDVVILALPIPQVWKLQLRRPEKVGVTMAFCLGFFVVFASAYRFTVLFTYTNTDPTYSLAPTVGWTAIEMSAGIVSACLPTIGPVVGLCARKLGIKRTPLSSLSRSHGASAAGLSGNHKTPSSSLAAARSTNTTTTNPADVLSEMELQRTGTTRKDGAGAFYRLPDPQNSAEEDEEELDKLKKGRAAAAAAAAAPAAADAGLRPDHGHYAYQYAVTTRPAGEGKTKSKGSKAKAAEPDNSSGDEVPLHGIRVQTDFRRSE
ncbi:uncharacterized protein P884DRAFT_211066 [Thermothelomyces heterothallicus CBS 202.75]|uniref:uncharacterized protein n=1 Tax=Thermothelomyces heterothallicus CBS 202.75 TaxID=1149848 RepID=UPI003743FAA3